MTILLTLLMILLALGALLAGLAWKWSHTPHGRLKPVFALSFRLGPLLRPGAADRAIAANELGTPEEAARVRADFLKNVAPLAKPVPFSGTIEDRELPGAPGGVLPVRIYRPEVPASAGPLPLLVYFHGGGFVVGSPDYTDGVTRTLALEAPAVVVSVDYRLAPEHRFPAAADDAGFAVSWCSENAEALGARPRPVAVAGDSAGGNLAAVVAQRDRRAGLGRVGLQALIYPWVDPTRSDRRSHQAFGRGYGLTTLDVEECAAEYAPPGTDLSDPDLGPLQAKSLEGLAPAWIVTAGFDVLCDEGTEYAERLREAGVEVTHVHEPALPHGFITMTRVSSEATACLRALAGRLRAMA
jgi:acetyl esterase